MKRVLWIILALMLVFSFGVFAGGGSEGSSDKVDTKVVEEQQTHYGRVLPLPFYDYSIPRDIFIQIYDVVTTKAFVTYSVIETITGKVFFHGPSIGYGIPADTSLTNPLKIAGYSYQGGYAVSEQAEPNGLFSSKNTDGTWVLFLQNDGTVTPVYTEHKVTTFPFAVKLADDKSWVRADDKPTEFVVKIE